MNIYIHVEVAFRELDSKLLLAVIAASRGHHVMVSDMPSLMNGIHSRCLLPGIVHTKSLTPSEKKISRHDVFLKKDFLLTSLDEESGLAEHIDYDMFSRVRYSSRTLGQASAAFGWGPADTEALKKVYPDCASKIYMCGSPRVDLWHPSLADYWERPSGVPVRPYLLVSSNFGLANGVEPFYKFIASQRSAGYFERDQGAFKRSFGFIAEQYQLTYFFVDAVTQIANKNPGFDIVLRPHPIERVEAWKAYLDGVPNVHVIREGGMSSWVNNSFAVMHNGCTTAFEAVVAGKPVITYVPFTQRYELTEPNKLGIRASTPDEVLEIALALLDKAGNDFIGPGPCNENLRELVEDKIYIDDNELAAEKIVKVWESLAHEGLSQRPNWNRFQMRLMAAKMKHMIGSSLRKLFPFKFGDSKENYKFPPMDRKDICDRVSRLQNTLGLSESLECRVLSDRAVLVRKKS